MTRLDIRHHLPSLGFLLVTLIVLAGFAGAFVYTGVYNVGADAPHSRLVYNIVDQLRERAIASHARGIQVPADLNDPKRIAQGASLYNEMCTGCHLGPGLEKSEISQGLYPQAPEFTRGVKHTPAQQFWIIKHGVKLSAMPAWGKTHDDQLIWDMVAFLQALPKISPDQYKVAVVSAPASHDEMMEGMDGSKEHDTASKPHTHTHSEGAEHHRH